MDAKIHFIDTEMRFMNARAEVMYAEIYLLKVSMHCTESQIQVKYLKNCEKRLNISEILSKGDRILSRVCASKSSTNLLRIWFLSDYYFNRGFFFAPMKTADNLQVLVIVAELWKESDGRYLCFEKCLLWGVAFILSIADSSLRTL